MIFELLGLGVADVLLAQDDVVVVAVVAWEGVLVSLGLLLLQVLEHVVAVVVLGPDPSLVPAQVVAGPVQVVEEVVVVVVVQAFLESLLELMEQ